jgi:hypothetical protein
VPDCTNTYAAPTLEFAFGAPIIAVDPSIATENPNS